MCCFPAFRAHLSALAVCPHASTKCLRCQVLRCALCTQTQLCGLGLVPSAHVCVMSICQCRVCWWVRHICRQPCGPGLVCSGPVHVTDLCSLGCAGEACRLRRGLCGPRPVRMRSAPRLPTDGRVARAGDFVDRGSFSVEVILALMAWRVLLPGHLHLARGNHESKGMNKIYGFDGEASARAVPMP